MQTNDQQALHGALRYAQFRDPAITQQKTFLNPGYVCSALSPATEAERVARLRRLAQNRPSVSQLAEALLAELLGLPELSGDDRLVLDSLYRTPDFLQARREFGGIDPHDPDYPPKYVDAFGNLADIVNQARGPFSLLVEGNRVVNVISDFSRCVRETEWQQGLPQANGCERKH